MKYFKTDYWIMMNSIDSKIREKGEIKWREISIAYQNYFDSIKENLTKEFLSYYYRTNGFHDAMIKSISIEYYKSKERILKICIEISNIQYVLKYVGVRILNINVPDSTNLVSDIMYWGYDEIELGDDKCWIHRILCNNDSEFDITCKRISIKKINIRVPL